MKTSYHPKASDFVDYAVAGGGGSGFCSGLGAGLSVRATSFYGDQTVTATTDGTRHQEQQQQQLQQQQQQHILRQPATSASTSSVAAAATSKRKRQTGEFFISHPNSYYRRALALFVTRLSKSPPIGVKRFEFDVDKMWIRYIMLCRQFSV